MDTNQLLQQLVDGGCLVQDFGNHVQIMPTHAELVTPAPHQAPPAEGWLYWIEAGAQDQHQAHILPYATVEAIHDRDLLFKDANGDDVAYLAPLEEWPDVSVQDEKERLVLARHAQAESPEAWQDFVDGCRPKPEDAVAA